MKIILFKRHLNGMKYNTRCIFIHIIFRQNRGAFRSLINPSDVPSHRRFLGRSMQTDVAQKGGKVYQGNIWNTWDVFRPLQVPPRSACTHSFTPSFPIDNDWQEGDRAWIYLILFVPPPTWVAWAHPILWPPPICVWVDYGYSLTDCSIRDFLNLPTII